MGSRVSSRTYRSSRMLRILWTGSTRSFVNTGLLFSGKKVNGGHVGLVKKWKNYSVLENELVQAIFRENMYPTKMEKEDLAWKTGRSVDSVNKKFTNERQIHSKVFGQKLEPPNEYTDAESQILQASFAVNEWPDESENRRLAIELDRPVKSIHDWFVWKRKETENPGKKE